MIDLHAHILPGMDDGPRSLAEAIALCELSARNGFTDTVLTPHFYHFSEMPAFLCHREEVAVALTEALEENEIPQNLHLGAEVAACRDLLEAQSLKELTLAGSRYLLLELPWSSTPIRLVVDYVTHIRDQGLIPVIPHPERYPYVQEDSAYLRLLIDSGAIFQLNLTSLTGEFGVAARQISRLLLAEEATAFIATDVHSMKNPRNQIRQWLRELSGLVSAYRLEQFLVKNPQAVLRDEELIL